MTIHADPSTFPSVLDPASAGPDFSSLGLPDPLVRTLARQRITEPADMPQRDSHGLLLENLSDEPRIAVVIVYEENPEGIFGRGGQ